MKEVIAVLIPFGMMATAVLLVYFINSFRYKERIEMVKMGLTPPPRVGYLRGLAALFCGLLIIAVGIGLLAVQFFNYDKEEFVGGVICIFVGISLVVYYKMTKPQREQNMRLQEEYNQILTRQLEASGMNSSMNTEIDKD